MANTTEKVTYIYDVNTSNVDSNLNKTNKIFSNTAKQATILGGAIAGAGVGMFKLADSASDLNESMNVVNEVFGESADTIVEWSETSITAMGISQTQALKTAGTYGAMATAQGINAEEAANMAMELTQLSADMASFYNVSQDVAANSLKGVFTGETEALKQFGIMLDETTLKQYGYEQSMSASEKIMIRYEAVMDQTAKAQGDFARTSDGMANQTRILQEQMAQLAIVLGQKLLPTVEKLVQVMNDDLAVIIATLSGDTSNLTAEQKLLYDQFQELIPTIITVAKIIGVMVVAWISYVVIGTVVNTVMSIYNAIMAVTNALQAIFNSKIIKTITSMGVAITQWIVTNSLMLINNTISLVKITIQTILNSTIWLTVTALIAQGFAMIWANIIVIAIIAGVVLLIYVFFKLFDVSQIVTTAVNLLTSAFEYMLNIITEVGNFISAVFMAVLNTLLNIINKIKSDVISLANAFKNTLKQAINIVLTPIRALIDLFNELLNIIFDVTDAILGGLIGAFNAIPFVPNIETSSANLTPSSANVNTFNNAQNINYNIQTQRAPTFREAQREKRFVQHHGHLYTGGVK